VRESFAAHTIPVFTYYQMLQSAPSVGGSEQARDLSNIHNLRATRDAGVIGLLFGAGASGNTTDMTDGRLFHRLARLYESHPVSVAGLF
jgi:hypothetical protein